MLISKPLKKLQKLVRKKLSTKSDRKMEFYTYITVFLQPTININTLISHETAQQTKNGFHKCVLESNFTVHNIPAWEAPVFFIKSQNHCTLKWGYIYQHILNQNPVPEFLKGSFSAWKQAENAHFWKRTFSPRDKRGSET